MRYECAPGEHLFWAYSENKDFITAELEAGKIYFVEAVPSSGWGQAVVYLVPIDPKGSERVGKIEMVVNKRTPQSLSEAEVEKISKKLQRIIPKALERHKEDVEKGKNSSDWRKLCFMKKRQVM